MQLVVEITFDTITPHQVAPQSQDTRREWHG
jgi:hypothetical protein